MDLFKSRKGHLFRDHAMFDKCSFCQGADSISDYPVSFHYVRGDKMNEMEYLVYRAHAYGIVGGLDHVNPHKEST